MVTLSFFELDILDLNAYYLNGESENFPNPLEQRQKVNLKIYTTYLIILLMYFFSFWIPDLSYGETQTDSTIVGYRDKNHDGINDRFTDANGDGFNDVTQKMYPHSFKFEDKNKDGKNDLWIDKDGDGVNDLMATILKNRGIQAKTDWVDRNGDGLLDEDVMPKYATDLSEFVLDENHDNKNDITGLEVRADNTMGYRYGYIDEERNKAINKFIDKNEDGMHDKYANRFRHDTEMGARQGQYDYFIDTDGDGIGDGRGFKRRGNPNTGQRGGRNKP